MIERTRRRFNLKPNRLAADTAYGSGKFFAFVVGAGIIPHIPVWDMSKREDNTFSRADFVFKKNMSGAKDRDKTKAKDGTLNRRNILLGSTALAAASVLAAGGRADPSSRTHGDRKTMTGDIDSVLRRLNGQLDGRVSTQGDERYKAATAIWAKPVGRKPRAIVHCRASQDIQFAIAAARSAELSLSVRGGGHDWAGRALCDGIVLDLNGMRDVVVDPDQRTAWVSGGTRGSDLLAATDPIGLAAVTGSCSPVGMAGLTLGGGYGPLIGRFGLALDNLIAADVVLADGRMVTAERGRDEELFWALRGGGGSFGVVTAMRIRLHELPSVVSGALVYPFSEAREVLRRYADAAQSMPEDLTVQIGAVTGPDGIPVIMILPTWSGSRDEADTHMAPFLKLGTALSNTVGPVRYGVSVSVFDRRIVNGRRVFMETCSLPVLDATGIDLLVKALASAPSAGCAILTHEFKGAASRVPLEATAFGLRCVDRDPCITRRRIRRAGRAAASAMGA
jgi:hypothetical protein